MGFFSWNCKECGLPIMSPYSVPDGLHWMNECVVLTKNHTTIQGKYDGYGNIREHDIRYVEPAMYHKDCYSGQDWDGESDSAECQGYFWNMCDYLDSFKGGVPQSIENDCYEDEYNGAWMFHEGDDLI